jgi:hypothetical protein
MSAETRIRVRVLRAAEEWITVSAVTRLDAEMEARKIPGIIAVLEACYEEDFQEEYKK